MFAISTCRRNYSALARPTLAASTPAKTLSAPRTRALGQARTHHQAPSHIFWRYNEQPYCIDRLLGGKEAAASAGRAAQPTARTSRRKIKIRCRGFTSTRLFDSQPFPKVWIRKFTEPDRHDRLPTSHNAVRAEASDASPATDSCPISPRHSPLAVKWPEHLRLRKSRLAIRRPPRGHKAPCIVPLQRLVAFAPHNSSSTISPSAAWRLASHSGFAGRATRCQPNISGLHFVSISHTASLHLEHRTTDPAAKVNLLPRWLLPLTPRRRRRYLLDRTRCNGHHHQGQGVPASREAQRLPRLGRRRRQ